MYGDGPELHFDYYNSFVIHPMLLDVLGACKDESSAWKDLAARAETRAKRYAAIQERLIAPDGSFPAVGRSIAYRFGAFHLLAQSALRHALPTEVTPAQIRGALTPVIRRTIDAPNTFSEPVVPYSTYLEVRQRATTLEGVHGFQLDVQPMSMTAPGNGAGAERMVVPRACWSEAAERSALLKADRLKAGGIKPGTWD